MAIESRSEAKVIKAPGLHKGVYVDPGLRSPNNYGDVPTHVVEWDLEEEMDFSDVGNSEPVDSSVPRIPRIDAHDLSVLGYGSSLSAVDADLHGIRQQFGLDADGIEVSESLDGALDLDLDAAHASELALAGMVGAVRDNFKVTGVNGLSGSVRDASDAKVLEDAAKRQARSAKSGSIPCTPLQ